MMVSSSSSTPPASSPWAPRSTPRTRPCSSRRPEASTSGVVWIAVCRRSQKVSGHDLRGKVVWTRQLPWEAWSLVKAGPFAIIASADGRVRALDRAGTARFEGDATGSSSDQFAIDEAGKPLRVTRRNVHLICAAFDGRVRWRAVSDEPFGPFVAGAAGVASPSRPFARLVQGQRSRHGSPRKNDRVSGVIGLEIAYPRFSTDPHACACPPLTETQSSRNLMEIMVARWQFVMLSYPTNSKKRWTCYRGFLDIM